MTATLGEDAAAEAARPFPWGLALRAAMTAGLVGLIALYFADRLAAVEWAAVAGGVAALPLATLGLAVACMVLSHVGLAGYDALAFDRIGRRIALARSLAGGFAATVIAQTLGCGLVTGSLARARLYRSDGVAPAEAVALTLYVTLGFFCGLFALVCGLTLLDPSGLALLGGLAPGRLQIGAALALLLIGLGLGCARTPRARRIAGLRLRAPEGRWLLSVTLLVALDVAPAALCLYVLLPAEAAPPVAAFVAIYAVAASAGYLIGAPGAVGPLEGALFFALPQVAAADLAAAILVYRAIYNGPPLLLALGLAAAARPRAAAPTQQPRAICDRVAWILDAGDRAEGELAWLGDKSVFLAPGGGAFALYAPSGRIWLMMGDPYGPRAAWGPLMDAFEAAARRAGACVAVYKAEAAAAAFWRARGLALQPLGEDAVLDPRGFSLDGPARRELRRKVAQIRKAGVTLAAHAPGAAPLDELAEVAAAWRAAKGGREQTFSMGHWDPAFVARHWVFEARVAGRPVAMISVWTSGDGRDWTLDLMRHCREAPGGAMHALVVRAIEEAAAQGAARFSLCMAPLSGLDRIAPVTRLSRIGHAACARLDRRFDLAGLRRFKDSFRPDWTPRFLAAAGPLQTVEALVAAARLVRGQARGKGGFRHAGTPAPAQGGAALPAPEPEAAPVEHAITQAA